MVQSALQVYLDSSDISVFTHPPGNRATEVREIEAFLRARQAEGHIQLRFSEAQVTEAAPTSREAIPEASARLAKIQELCGTHCLWHFFDIVSEEVRRSAGGRVLARSEVQRDDGFWYPALFETEFLLTPEALLGKFQHLGRKERREYLKDDQLTPAARQQFRMKITASVRALATGLPLGPSAVEVLTQYYLGQLTRADAERTFRRSLADLGEFAKWYETDNEAAMQFSSFLRETGSEFRSELEKARDEYSSLLGDAALAEHPKRQLDQVVKNSFASVLRGAATEVAQGIAGDLGVTLDASKVENAYGAFPGLVSATTLALHVARRSVVGDSPRPAAESDFGDIYHAVYMPYVDIYRTDVFMASLIGEAKLPAPTVLVRRLVDLPSAIEQALREGQARRTVG